jgi:outer membrane protein assembly factor BamD
MSRSKLSTLWRALALCSASALLVACSSVPTDRTASMSVEKIYETAQDDMKIGAWDKAIPLLDKLEGLSLIHI